MLGIRQDMKSSTLCDSHICDPPLRPHPLPLLPHLNCGKNITTSSFNSSENYPSGFILQIHLNLVRPSLMPEGLCLHVPPRAMTKHHSIWVQVVSDGWWCEPNTRAVVCGRKSWGGFAFSLLQRDGRTHCRSVHSSMSLQVCGKIQMKTYRCNKHVT